MANCKLCPIYQKQHNLKISSNLNQSIQRLNGKAKAFLSLIIMFINAYFLQWSIGDVLVAEAL